MAKNLRNSSFKSYGLSPSHYLSAPGLSWDAILNMTKLRLNLFQMPTCICSLKKGIRGRVSYISKRYSKVSNKYLKSYDPK